MLLIDKDFLVDQVFWNHASELSDRLTANDLLSEHYLDTVQVMRLEIDRSRYLMPWPLGRACDITFGNRIGVFPTPEQVAEGWRMTNWLQAHADALWVQYLIWQGHIWSVARDTEGWRPYDGGGMHNPTHPTGGHYDHLHITTRL